MTKIGRARAAAIRLVALVSSSALLMPASALGAADVKLNGTLVAGGDASVVPRPAMFLDEIDFPFHITADSARVIYVADQDSDQTFELYSRPLDGSGAAAKLNGPLAGSAGVGLVVLPIPSLNSFPLSSDLSRVVYVVDQDTASVFELYSRPPDGSGSSVKLSGTLTAGGQVLANLRLSADASRVVYLADADTDGVVELYSRPLDGSGSPAKINGPMVAGGNARLFEISADSSRVVYVADQDSDQTFELYSRPLDGSGTAAKLNGTLVAGGQVGGSFTVGQPPTAGWFVISADSSRVVYVADQDSDGVHELYSRPLDGSGSPAKLNGALVAGGDVSLGSVAASSFGVSPDSSRVVYIADQDTDGVDELYSRPLDGSGSPAKLNDPLVAGGRVVQFEISADSSRVVYRAEQDTDGVLELYSRPLDGSGSSVKLSGTLQPGPGVQAFRISADSSQVVYSADEDGGDAGLELYARAIDGTGSAVELSAGSSADVGAFKISADSSLVVYVSDRDLYARPLDGSGSSRRLNGTAVPGGGIYGTGGAALAAFQFDISPDTSRVVYIADQEQAQRFELFATDLTALEDCGNGVVDAGEECDDGNTAAGDCCSPTCAAETGLPCADDGDLCSRDVCDAAATCTHPEAPIAASSCQQANKALLLLRNAANPAGRRAMWKWIGGPVVFDPVLGDPEATTDYSLCVYDSAGVILRTGAAAGGLCGTNPCWKATATGFKYRNALTSPNGTLRMVLRHGGGTHARRIVVGKGANLSLPSDLQLTQPLTAQLINSDGRCWSSTFTAPAIRSGVNVFKDRAP